MDDFECEVLSGEIDSVGAGGGAYVAGAARSRERRSLEREPEGGQLAVPGDGARSVLLEVQRPGSCSVRWRGDRGSVFPRDRCGRCSRGDERKYREDRHNDYESLHSSPPSDVASHAVSFQFPSREVTA